MLFGFAELSQRTILFLMRQRHHVILFYLTRQCISNFSACHWRFASSSIRIMAYSHHRRFTSSSFCVMRQETSDKGGPTTSIFRKFQSYFCRVTRKCSVSDPGPFVRIRIRLFSSVRIRIGQKIWIRSGTPGSRKKKYKKKKKMLISYLALSSLNTLFFVRFLQI